MNTEIKGKNLIRNLLKTTSIITLLSLVTLSFNVNAARNYENTWFEIEVILFSQIDDKSKLQEAFPESSKVKTPSSVIDLLGPYLDPNISDLKNRLPVCSDYTNISELDVLNNSFTLNYLNFDEQVAKDVENNFYIFSQIQNILEEVKQTVTEQESAFPITSADYNLTGSNALEPIIESNVQKNFRFTQVSLPQEFCKIPESFFFEYKKENPNFYYNGPAQNNIPSLISGEEDFTTDQPYLLNEESLQLHDIVKQLKRSRNFKPLLHLGWRQVTKGPKEAIPLKLYAGENLIQPYNQALADYQRTTQNALTIQESNQLVEAQVLAFQYDQNTGNEIITEINDSNLNEERKLKALQNQITDVLLQAKEIEPELSSLLAEINSGPDELVTPVVNPLLTDIESVTKQQLIEPIKPPQNWTIEGLLKVEVEHFLHITADFNVINMSLSEQATKQLTSTEPIMLKSIRLEQNKRVRSKEIHYFDHPYMGIIVQIRRHEQIPLVEEIKDDQVLNPIDN